VVPLLSDPDAEVRRAAMLTVGPAGDGSHPVVGNEELFRWLHDRDPEVRELCGDALKTRGLDAEQVHLARQLTHPDPAERLKLLVDLRFAGEAVKDPGPWLERLSRDPDPAVRLGAARVAFESRLLFAGWLDRLADQDPDPTVRRWAGYYRGLSATVKQAGFRP
jgi:HEAT repeat protein